jgi:hypothetical protein
MAYDGSSRAEGLALYVDGRRADCEVVRDHLVKDITGGGSNEWTIGQRFRDRGFKDGKVDELQVLSPLPDADRGGSIGRRQFARPIAGQAGRAMDGCRPAAACEYYLSNHG